MEDGSAFFAMECCLFWLDTAETDTACLAGGAEPEFPLLLVLVFLSDPAMLDV